MSKTLNSRNSADICRANGWSAGTRLVGDEGYGPTVIEITGVGEESILAKTITHNGKQPRWTYEGVWTLSCRAWKEVSDE
jgi:hypothetical protein